MSHQLAGPELGSNRITILVKSIKSGKVLDNSFSIPRSSWGQYLIIVGQIFGKYLEKSLKNYSSGHGCSSVSRKRSIKMLKQFKRK